MFSLIFDIAMVLIIVVYVCIYAHKGLVSGLLGLVGTVAALVGGFLLAKYGAPIIFQTFLKSTLETSTAQAIATQGVLNLEELLNGLVGFLPAALISKIATDYGDVLNFSSENIASQVVTGVVEPLVSPIIGVVIFIVVFVIINLVLRALQRLFTGINKIPVVGGINRVLGAVMGLLMGVLYVFVIMVLIKVVYTYFGENNVLEAWINNGFAWKIAANIKFLTF